MSSPREQIRTVIVDDEEAARLLLRELLGQHPEVEIVGECANGFEAIKSVAELTPDLLFLDVRMPKLDGFEVLELLNDGDSNGRRPAVIFVTAYDEYAIKAFEVHALDYLLKPFSPERLAVALQRAKERRSEPSRAPKARRRRKPAREDPDGVSETSLLERILVRDGPRIHVIPVEKLEYVEAQDDYVVLAAGGKKLRKQQTLSGLAACLDPGRFVHVHRSYLLNVDHLARIELYAKDSRLAILRDGSRVPVSRAGYGRLRKLL